MDQAQQSAKQPNYGMIGIVVGIVLAIAFIVIGSIFFDLKPGPSTPSNSTDTIDTSLYAPSQ